MRFDFHIHSKYSPCSNMEPELIAKTAIKKGLNGINITDHNTLKCRNKIRNKELLITYSDEIKTNQGEIIGFNIHKEIKPGLSPEETIDKIKEQGGLVIIPHPFDFFRKNIGFKVRKLKGIDAMEINARNITPFGNALSKSFASRMHVPLTAGSDAHFYYEIGRAYSELKASNKDELIKAIKEKKIIRNYCSSFSIKGHISTLKLKKGIK